MAIACEQVDVPVRVALEGIVRHHHRWRSDGLERGAPALAARLVQLGAGAAGCERRGAKPRTQRRGVWRGSSRSAVVNLVIL